MSYTPIDSRRNYDGFGRIQIDDGTSDVEITDINNPTELSDSVGNSGKNNRRDVAKIETLLGQVGALDLKQTDGPTGYWGMRTADATKKVQADNGLKVDAEIAPGGPTGKVLAQLALLTKNNDKSEYPGETPEIEPPDVDPNMPIIRKPLPQWDFRTLPYLDKHGNPVGEGKNPKTKERVRPRIGPI